MSLMRFSEARAAGRGLGGLGIIGTVVAGVIASQQGGGNPSMRSMKDPSVIPPPLPYQALQYATRHGLLDPATLAPTSPEATQALIDILIQNGQIDANGNALTPEAQAWLTQVAPPTQVPGPGYSPGMGPGPDPSLMPGAPAPLPGGTPPRGVPPSPLVPPMGSAPLAPPGTGPAAPILHPTVTTVGPREEPFWSSPVFLVGAGLGVVGLILLATR